MYLRGHDTILYEGFCKNTRPLFLFYALLKNLAQLDPINHTLLGLSVKVIKLKHIKHTNISVSHAFASKVYPVPVIS